MSELLENEEQVAEQQEVQAREAVAEQPEEAVAEEAVVLQEGVPEAETAEGEVVAEAAPKKKLTKKQMIIIGAAALAVIIALFAIFYKSKFERVRDEAIQIAGIAGTGKNYFTLDTYPEMYNNMDSAVRAMLLGRAQQNALEAIKYANKELGFGSSVYERMMNTSAIMGRQYAENDKYEVSWTYHPDKGLEVRYEKK